MFYDGRPVVFVTALHHKLLYIALGVLCIPSFTSLGSWLLSINKVACARAIKYLINLYSGSLLLQRSSYKVGAIARIKLFIYI